MKTFLNYTRNDANVFATFKPDSSLLKQMKFSSLILSKNKEEAENAKEFASFVLRYHENIDYGDFSDEPVAI